MHIRAGVPFRVLQDDLPADDPRKQCSDISLAQKKVAMDANSQFVSRTSADLRAPPPRNRECVG